MAQLRPQMEEWKTSAAGLAHGVVARPAGDLLRRPVEAEVMRPVAVNGEHPVGDGVEDEVLTDG